MVEIKFHTESPSKLIHELMPLFEKHFAEVYAKDYPDQEIKIDENLYAYLEEHDIYRAFTIRTVHGKAVGYAGFFLKDHPHMGIRQATQDLIFIDPDFRGCGVQFIKYCEEQLMAAGTKVVIQFVSSKLDFSPILLRGGYRLLETAYAKNL